MKTGVDAVMELKIFKGFERFEDHYPAEAVKYAMENRTEAIPELLEILEYTLSDVENLSVDGNYLIHFPATYILPSPNTFCNPNALAPFFCEVTHHIARNHIVNDLCVS